MAVIEGVMGYFDGVAGISTTASSYDIARITKTPVILIVDCKGASLSIAALIKGFLEYGQEPMIRGVILNRISQIMAKRLKPLIEELGVMVVGWIPECEEMKLESRHLGLVLPGELEHWQEQLQRIAGRLNETLDLNLLLQMAETSEDLKEASDDGLVCNGKLKEPASIAVARDEAFCFYYQENIRLLEKLGAEILYFSPLRDETLPENTSGVLLGGGYPELYAQDLSENTSMLQSIRSAAKKGMPILAECGGFLYLHEMLEDPDGAFFPMAGVIEAGHIRRGGCPGLAIFPWKADGQRSCVCLEKSVGMSFIIGKVRTAEITGRRRSRLAAGRGIVYTAAGDRLWAFPIYIIRQIRTF